MIVAVTGGRDRYPSLAELEAVMAVLLPFGPHATLRNGKGGRTDETVAAYVSARDLAGVEYWPADWNIGAKAGPLRNRAMLDGKKGDEVFPPLRASVELLLALEGGRGTADCVRAATERGITVAHIEPVAEPRPWNRHHGKPPGPSVYIGRNDKDPRKPSPLGNPFELKPEPGESRAQAAPRVLGQYRRWLHAQLVGPERDPRVIAALEAITPETYLVCSCWPKHCHAEVVIRAWRWWREEGG